MRIGFYAPLKAPDHPVPSGDRQMARLLIAAIRRAGHEVEVSSRLRSFARDPEEPSLAALRAAADDEVGRLTAAWADPALRPELLFTYHPYYKAPDLVGPRLAARFELPYATAEASLSARRAVGAWAERQGLVAAAVRGAALNLCFTERDRAGLASTATPASLMSLPPFIDATAFGQAAPGSGPVRLVTVAMMRPGDKYDSYRFLASALARLTQPAWHLTVVGDGPARPSVMAALAALPVERVTIVGAVTPQDIPGLLGQADLMVWPGFNEAFGLCYLEAQACGLPVVAVRNAGTPSVVRDGETGLLTPPDPAAYAAAVERLMTQTALRIRMGAAAIAFVHNERSLPEAARHLDRALRAIVGPVVA